VDLVTRGHFWSRHEDKHEPTPTGPVVHLQRTVHMTNELTVSGSTSWNSLPLTVYDPSLTLTQFCALLKTMLFCRDYVTLPWQLCKHCSCTNKNYLLTYYLT